MLDVLYCIRDDHDIKLVLLAALVCSLSTATAGLMIRQSVRSNRAAARIWMIAGGLATGFGIWATHFIAMLGYHPGVIAGYHPFQTAGSLAIVLATTIIAFRIATSRSSRSGNATAAVIAGGGFAAMHYLGMAALQMPATIHWDMGYVSLSLLLAVLPLYPAIGLAIQKASIRSGLASAAIMTLAVVGLHFTGMAAISLVPSRMAEGALLLSPNAMSTVISAVSLLLLGLCITGWTVARRTHAAIAANRQQFSILVKGISDCALYMLDNDGKVASWNAGAQRLKGYTEEEIVGSPLASFYTSEDQASGLPVNAIETARQTGKFTGQGWRVRKDGSKFWAHVTVERILDEAGRAVGFAKITRDMTRFKEDQDRIQEAHRRLDAALENMHQGLCLFDADERLVLTNHRFAELWNLPAESCAPGIALTDLVSMALQARNGAEASPTQIDDMCRMIVSALKHPERSPMIADLDDHFCVSISSCPLDDGGWVSTFEDITERRRSEARIAHLAHHDVLTGLPNRASFNRWLDREIENAAARERRVALIAIDLDRFKEVNDTHGHAAGDMVLVRLANAFNEFVQDGEMAARLGGDEFALAKHFSHQHELDDFIARLEGALESLNDGSDMPLPGASMGAAIYPVDANGREMLLNNADLAMYRAKSSLSESICYYEEGMDEQARRRRQMGNDLRQAIARDEFTILYQEQRSVSDGVLSGYEALLRWHHPVFGPVSPTDFIPIAEENGEIMRIGEWVLENACREATQWPESTKLAVNLSPVQLLKPDLPELVTEILLRTGLSARRLELEITESAIISDKVRALHSLRRIKALGVSVAMDDFGTGYSSLDTLHSFPFDKIKIDKSFLMQSDTSEQARAIIRAVLALGHSLGIPVLAEGVETRGQLALLINEGCQEAQGYLFGRPAQAPSTLSEETPAPRKSA